VVSFNKISHDWMIANIPTGKVILKSHRSSHEKLQVSEINLAPV
jgi:hypothetical protein